MRLNRLHQLERTIDADNVLLCQLNESSLDAEETAAAAAAARRSSTKTTKIIKNTSTIQRSV